MLGEKIVYYLIFLTGTLFMFIDGRNKLLYRILFLLILGTAIFRYGVGTDYFAYEHLYESLRSSVLEEYRYPIYNHEMLFRLFGAFLKGQGINFQMYLGSIAIIQLVFINKIIKKNSIKPIQSLFLYFCFFYIVWTFSGLRQGVAIAIGMYYFLEFSKDKNAKKFAVVVVILSSIHLSAAILLPLYLLINNRLLTKKNLVILSAISFGLSLLPMGILFSKLTFLPLINKAAVYIGTSYSFSSVLDFQSFARLFFLLLVFIHYDKLVKVEIMRKITNTFIVFLDLYFVLKFSELTAARLSIYGFILIIILLPQIYNLYKIKLNKLVLITSIIVLSLSYLQKDLNAMRVGTLVHQDGFLVPYTSIYNREDYTFLRENYFRQN